MAAARNRRRSRGHFGNGYHQYHRHPNVDNGNDVCTRKGSGISVLVRGEWLTRRSDPHERGVVSRDYDHNEYNGGGSSPTFSLMERDHPCFTHYQEGRKFSKSKHTRDQKKYSKSNEDFQEPMATYSPKFQITDNVDKRFPYYKGGLCYYMFTKDKKPICRMQCTNPPIQLPSSLNLGIQKVTSLKGLDDLPRFSLFPAFENDHQKEEWPKFMGFLYDYRKVGFVELNKLKIYILPSGNAKSNKTEAAAPDFQFAVVAYEISEDANGSGIKANSLPPNETQRCPKSPLIPRDACMNDPKDMSMRDTASSTHLMDAPQLKPDVNTKGSISDEKGTCYSVSKYPNAASTHQHFSTLEGNPTAWNFIRTDPSYLKTLGQAHSGWIFGAIAELVDNAMDANALRLDICMEHVYCRTAGCEIPMLSIIDDGDGMNHEEILRMISFGHNQPCENNTARIGRFGVGFKTGTMRLGSDALVLTQTAKSRSIAFFSQSLNKGKDNVEIPIVSYRRQTQYMEFDTSAQTEALAKYNLKAIKDFSPFNEYLIGEKAALFQRDTGTQIYIWNLEKWGSNYLLEWQAGISGTTSFYHGDILIRSRRVRSRPGQTSKKVCLDFSLRSYLEVIFLEPRMKIYIQGGLVKSRPLAKLLNNTAVIDGEIMGRHVQLTLGRCQEEWEYSNCGVFLYWHGRLIEAYKRVGGMIHSADMGRGVIGVVDVTELMDDGNGGAWVHNNKQGFQDCEAYALLEEWLANKADEYWDTHFDAIQLKKDTTTMYNPDHEWVQCEKCRKWRMLKPNFDSAKLVGDWFCNMEPFNGVCEMPEQKPDPEVITIGTKRVGVSTAPFDHKRKQGIHVNSDDPELEEATKVGNSRENNVARTRTKRVRKGLALG